MKFAPALALCAIAVIAIPVWGSAASNPETKNDLGAKFDAYFERTAEGEGAAVITLKATYPDAYAQMRAAMVNLISENAPFSEIEAHIRTVMGAFIVSKRVAISRAGPDEARALIQARAEVVDQLAMTAPAACHVMLTGGPPPDALIKDTSPDTLQALNKTMVVLLKAAKSGDESKSTAGHLTDDDQIRWAKALLAAGLTAEDILAFNGPEEKAWSTAKTCNFASVYLHTLAAQPGDFLQRYAQS